MYSRVQGSVPAVAAASVLRAVGVAAAFQRAGMQHKPVKCHESGALFADCAVCSEHPQADVNSSCLCLLCVQAWMPRIGVLAGNTWVCAGSQETAYLQKYPGCVGYEWHNKVQKYTPPGSSVTAEVPLFDVVSALGQRPAHERTLHRPLPCYPGTAMLCC
jgi:hypothetical protein